MNCPPALEAKDGEKKRLLGESEHNIQYMYNRMLGLQEDGGQT